MAELAQKNQPAYLALIGDIRGSRALPDRSAAQEHLREALARVEDELGSRLAARFAITLGDEFQGLVADPAAGLAVAVACTEAAAPLRLRFGLGWGPLTTELLPEAIGMDGPCFHRAREAIARAKQEEAWIAAAGFGEREDATLNALLDLLGSVRARWTDKQARIVALRRRRSVQRELARELGLDPSTVSKRLKSAMYGPVTGAERAVADLMGRFAFPDRPPGGPR